MARSRHAAFTPAPGAAGRANSRKAAKSILSAQDEVRALLGDRPRQRDLLIEHLHLLQDHYGCLHARHLAALAAEMRLAMAEVYEVASFYAHFDIVMEDEDAAPAADGAGLRQPDLRDDGRRAPARRVAGRLGPGVRVDAGALHGRLPPRARRGDRPCAARARERRERGGGRPQRRHASARPDLSSTSTPTRFGAATSCSPSAWTAARAVEDVIKTLEDSNLRGLGGAGFPTGRKWRFVRAEPGPRFMAVNARRGRARHVQGPHLS